MYVFNPNRSNSVSGLLSELQADEDFVHQQINNNELLSYCLGCMKDDGIDVLNYWKRNTIAYPTLQCSCRRFISNRVLVQ
jgi:hypothetical protein